MYVYESLVKARHDELMRAAAESRLAAQARRRAPYGVLRRLLTGRMPDGGYAARRTLRLTSPPEEA